MVASRKFLRIKSDKGLPLTLVVVKWYYLSFLTFLEAQFSIWVVPVKAVVK